MLTMTIRMMHTSDFDIFFKYANNKVGILLPGFYNVNNGNHDTSDFGKKN